MKVRIGKLGKAAVQALAVFKGARPPGGGSPAVRQALARGIFRGETGEVLPVLGVEGQPGAVVVGLGDRKRLSAETLRRAAGVLARRLRGLRAEVGLCPSHAAWAPLGRKLGWQAAARALAEGWHLGAYRFETFRSERAGRGAVPSLVVDPAGLARGELKALREGVRVGRAVAAGVCLARDLTNLPGNRLDPALLASEARKLARRRRLRCRVLGPGDLERLGMGALLAVARGSARPPRLIVVEYSPAGPGRRGRAARSRGREPLVLVGKSVTFDSGGLSIKPARGMEEMKYDTAGGAAVLGALQALSVLKPPLRVVGLLPAAENLIGSSAMRPGDIIRSASGRTIEVVNTDAEGRLLLADALHYARRFRPRAVVDVATLTGACVVALGLHGSGVMSNNTALARAIEKASRACGEKVWRLPLWEESFEATRSRVADLKNAAGHQGAALAAAAFLARFIEGVPWAHLDIAGPAWAQRDSGYTPAGGTGAGVRLLVELALSL